MQRIHHAIPIEELVESFPGVVGYLFARELPCLVCGEPLWSTLEELARTKGWTPDEIELLIDELNARFLQEEVR